jgi:nucleoid-associated protein YgaU
VVAHAAPDAIPRAAAGTATAAISGSPTTKVVSRGDSLWLISRLAYGDGMRYALIYKANRDRIRDPNRIYPGQTFVLPANAR